DLPLGNRDRGHRNLRIDYTVDARITHHIRAVRSHQISILIEGKVACTGKSLQPILAGHKKTIALDGKISVYARVLNTALGKDAGIGADCRTCANFNGLARAG